MRQKLKHAAAAFIGASYSIPLENRLFLMLGL
jgi:hypothetical protein